jgi:hypothetical protein
MIAPDCPNPFRSSQADDCLTIPRGYLPELHVAAITACSATIAQARQAGQNLGLFLVGDAGSGKSQLIAHWRSKIISDPNAILFPIRMQGAYTGNLWRHLRDKLVEELLRPLPASRNGADGLLRLLHNRFPKWEAAKKSPTTGLLSWFVSASEQADLSVHLEEYSRGNSFEHGLLRTLPQLTNRELASLAKSWLQGTQLDSQDLQRLGLQPVFLSEQEQETESRKVVLSLLRLAGEKTTCVLCFDELEAMQAGTWDSEVLRQFTTQVTALMGEIGPRVVVTSIRPKLLRELREVVEKSNVQKIAQQQVEIPYLTWEQSIQIAMARLEGEPACQAARKQHPADTFWPLGRNFLEQLFHRYRRAMTPRHLILACSDEWNRLQAGKPPIERKPLDGDSELTTEDEQTRAREFQFVWEEYRKRYLAKLQGISVDSVLGIALPWLVRLLDFPFDPVQLSLERINLTYQPRARGTKPIALSYCNHAPTLFWRHLDRLASLWEATKGKQLGFLIALRSETERTTDKAESRLASLRTQGVRVVIIQPQQLAELTAFQTLLSKVQTGAVTRKGRPVSATEYNNWTKDHLSSGVKDLLDLIFGPNILLPVPQPIAPDRVSTGVPARK